jgi:hypothetical protein
MTCIHKVGRLVGLWRGQPVVGGRDVAGGVWRVQVVTLLGRIIKATSPSCSLSKNMKINTQNNKKKVLFGMGVKLGISHYWK